MTHDEQWHDRAMLLAALARNLLYMHGERLDKIVKQSKFDKRTEERALEENVKCIDYWERMIQAFLGDDDA